MSRKVNKLLVFSFKRAASAPGDEVDDAVGTGVGDAVEYRVEFEDAVDESARKNLRRIGREPQRHAALVVVHMPGANQVRATAFEKRCEQARAIFRAEFDAVFARHLIGEPEDFRGVRPGMLRIVIRKHPAQIVTSAKARDSYIAKIQRRVGFAKGSWINAAKAIGGRVRGAAQWVTRHKQAPGTATVKTGNKPSVTLINNLDYIEQVSTHKGIELALQIAAGRLRKALVTSLQKINERASRNMRRAG